MESVKKGFEYIKYNALSELTPADLELVQKAMEQLPKAYAPYSGFHVGAAVRLADDSIFVGSNQENASYPLCMCGERVALYNAAANKPDVSPMTLAITIQNQKIKITEPASPCGACRQVISEYAFRHKQPIRILLKADSEVVYEIQSNEDLLPLGFNGSFL
ncbi:MAG TPA: cytidine deaminase [Saprospiraceae bacterium]|nr:cytidine deaminase [Saprospiraceae bacterium]HRO07729.1 cytidine deaminase [Saprospiraceae bacterium]HRO74130.1 cytidine deaminase [Saprospiraceae bacterium]HRP41045.1 cytidine deaminase [Saprospiraceae bacterium]